jgi:hypothetical protein
VKETATPCRHFVEKTADDCPDCAYFKASPMGHGSGSCRYPSIAEAEVGKQTGKMEPLLWMDVALYPGVGPYQSGEEERFKQDSIRAWESRRNGWSYFCIESPGTADGFPDVLALSNSGAHMLWEFKVSDARGVVRFERTQPSFYRKHQDLNIWALAWSVPSQRAIFIPARDIVAAKSLRYRLQM